MNLCVRGAAAAMEFYAKAFGAVETFRISDPEGRIAHAHLKFGPTIVMLADEYPESGVQSPLAFGGTGSTIHLHVKDVDANKEDVVWGTGRVDVRALLEELHRQQARNLIFSIEYEKGEGDELVANVAKSVEFFNNVVTELAKK